MDDYNYYIRYIDQELNATHNAKVKSNVIANGVFKILDHFLNGKTRRFVFMFPKISMNDVEITIRDVNNGTSTCVVITAERIHGYVVIIGHKSKFGECTRDIRYTSPRDQITNKQTSIQVSIPDELLAKINSNIYHQFSII